ncbi:ornithine cyclodeaminase family protein [Sphingosinicella soli]|uniref:Ornithine cyclodeaminase n=1 Tax=Sphingosinicella soli TaxID=333708 RepID=A0A7W7FA20_9SPHN|nr:ornithine cyclodeaminase family protein [Sphingosinicella soli]MBB4633248.1 ornithine cyclodeaminase [Sphingosinicella soli]
MKIVTEAQAREAVTLVEAIALMEQVFIALHRGEAEIFPVVLGHGSDPSSRFSMKGGLIRPLHAVGLKVGTYWPANRARGLESHGSTTLLLDDETGAPRAMVGATHLTALRTAAADGVATRALSRPESATLAVVGAGHQAWFEMLAVLAVRPIRNVAVWSRSPDAAAAFAERARRETGLDVSSGSIENICRSADIIITATAAREPLVQSAWVQPGTHISAMGADSEGKQELDTRLAGMARLFADSVEQSLSIGEFEAARKAGLASSAITSLGTVLAGDAPGRASADDITIFDSSGIALQDLAMAAHVLQCLENSETAA